MERTRYPGIYRRGNRYVAVVAYKDGFGRRKHKWLPPEPTLAKAKNARRKMLNEIELGLRPDGSRMTVAEFAEVWLSDAGTRLRPATVRAYRSAVENHVKPALGEIKLRDVNRRHLRALYEPLSPASAAAVHAALSAMFGFAVKDEAVLGVNPCATIRRPRYEAPEARHLEPAEARRMLSLAAGTPLEPAIVLGLAGGLRIGEVVAVRWADLDGDGTLTIRRSAAGKTKSGRVRSVTLPASASASLRRIRRAQAESLLALGIRQDGDTTVVADPLGRPVQLDALGRAFRAFCLEHGFALTFHALRHSNAIAMLTAGVDVKTAASRLGHSTPALLLETYSHYIRSADKAAAEKLEGMLGG